MSLVQAKPLSHKLSVMECENDKIKDNILQTSHILQSGDDMLSYKSQLKAIIVYSPASDFVMGLYVILIVAYLLFMLL